MNLAHEERRKSSMANNVKERILEVTLELANEKGLGRVSISQIAQQVGLKKSSIYSHFSSKDEIIEEMYRYFRGQAVQMRATAPTDYGAIVEGKTLKEVLHTAVSSYLAITKEPKISMFYRVIMSERPMNKMAAEIMVMETNTMIQATKQLFYAMQAKRVVTFENPDAAALSFAMGVHAVIEYMEDAAMADSSAADYAMETYIEEFSRAYGNL